MSFQKHPDNVEADLEDDATTEDSKANDKNIDMEEEDDDEKKTYKDVLISYAEISTIAGVVQFSMVNVTFDTKVFWTSFLLGFLIISLVWSAATYFDWVDSPVTTTITNVGYEINKLDFPTVTICSQGYQMDRMMLSADLLFRNFSEEHCGLNLDENESNLLDLFLWNDKCLISFVNIVLPSLTEESLNILISFSYPPGKMIAGLFGGFVAVNPPIAWLGVYNILKERVELNASTSYMNTINVGESASALGSYLYMMDMFLNWNVMLKKVNSYNSAFGIYNNINSKLIFEVLWKSSLECSDQGGFIKNCEWKGNPYPCEQIFRRTLTDLGICCSFHSDSAQDIYLQSTFSDIVKSLEDDSVIARDDKFYHANAGINIGLSFMLDTHSETIGTSTFGNDYNSFTMTLTSRGDFPLMQKNGISIQPGMRNLVAIQADFTQSDDGLRTISPEDRNCKFNDETVNLTIYKQYSQNNCLFECKLHKLKDIMSNLLGEDKHCTRWNFPSASDDFKICSPMDAQTYLSYLDEITTNDCDLCLPDCSRAQYSFSMSTEPFRGCDEKNFGVSKFCSYKNLSGLATPYLWSANVLNQLGSETNITRNLSSSIRNVATQWPFFKSGQNRTDAYDADIALVNVFLDQSTAVYFDNQPSQTWFSFFANAGGILGLFVGVSIVTVFELTWLCIRLCEVFKKKHFA